MILVDERERNNAQGRYLADAVGGQMATLEYGDYLIVGQDTALVERVTNTGLLADIETGRMVEKLEGCASDAGLVFLLVERMIFPDLDGKCLVQEDDGSTLSDARGERVQVGFSCRRTRWNYSAVATFLGSTALRWAHIIRFTSSVFESAQVIKGWEAYLEKPDHDLHLARTRPFTMGKGAVSQGEYILSAFPGVGTAKAAAIMKHFGRLPLTWTCGTGQLAQVPGFGRASAKKLKEVLDHD